MKRLLVSASAFLALAGSAIAADLPGRGGAVAPAPMSSPIFTWEGFYVGAQAGYVWGRSNIAGYTAAGAIAGAGNFKPKGMVGGIHAGYNFQSGALVYGVELDAELSGVKYTDLFASGTRARESFRGSARLRAGFAFDRALLYVTGGAAFTNHEAGTFDGARWHSFSGNGMGWTVGAGVEYAVTNNWTVRGEYRYSDFGTKNSALPAVFAPAVRIRDTYKDNAFRIGVSYRFGGPAGPVVAKY
ncbi:MAG: outer membrane protein [Beijerinckiaceae bacterium]